MKRLPGVFLALLITVCMLGCGPLQSKYPLSPAEDKSTDERLLGTWRGHPADDESVEITLFIEALEDGSAQMRLTSKEKDGELGEMSFNVFTSKLGRRRFMNLMFESGTEPEEDYEEWKKGYIFARYNISRRGELTMWIVNDDVVGDAVEAGKLKGEVSQGQWTRDVFLTDGPENLARYFKRTRNPELYELWATYKKAD